MSRSTRFAARFFIIAALVCLSIAPANGQVPGLTGRVAFFSDRDGYWNIWTIDLDDGDTRRVTHFPQDAEFVYVAYPEWSKSGEQILFGGWAAGVWRQYLINADGTGFRPLPTRGRVQRACWDPVDDHYIYYHEDWGWGTGQYHRMNINPPYDDQVIPKSPDFYENRSSGDDGWDVTTDGTRILTSRDYYYQYSYMVYQDMFGATVLPFLFERLPGRTLMGKINRQDGWVIYHRASQFPGWGPINLVKTNADGSVGEILLTDARSGEFYEYPNWTRGGNDDYILFDGNRSGNAEIYAMKAVPGAFPDGLINLTNNAATDWFPNYTPTTWNTPPVADAGQDAYVDCTTPAGTSVTLDGSASSDPDGDPLTYTWTGPFPEGNGTVTGANPTVTLPLGPSTLTLVVNDGQVDSAPDAVTVSVNLRVVGFEPPLGPLSPEGNPVRLPDKAFKQGRSLPLRLQTFCGGASVCGTGITAPRIVGLVRSGEALDIDTLDLDAGNANDGGVDFRAADGHWIFNLSTKSLPAGTYTITVQMMDKTRWESGFVLK